MAKASSTAHGDEVCTGGAIVHLAHGHSLTGHTIRINNPRSTGLRRADWPGAPARVPVGRARHETAAGVLRPVCVGTPVVPPVSGAQNEILVLIPVLRRTDGALAPMPVPVGGAGRGDDGAAGTSHGGGGSGCGTGRCCDGGRGGRKRNNPCGHDRSRITHYLQDVFLSRNNRQ